MKAIDIDARRYIWCRGQSIWQTSMPLNWFEEDLRGALADGQDGLVRFTARNIGQTCGVVINLVVNHARPLPAGRMRAAWALEAIADHPLAGQCRLLVVSPPDRSAAELADIAQNLITDIRALVGEIPDPITPEGYFPALATARDWLKLADAVGTDGFLPAEWTNEEAH